MSYVLGQVQSAPCWLRARYCEFNLGRGDSFAGTCAYGTRHTIMGSLKEDQLVSAYVLLFKNRQRH